MILLKNSTKLFLYYITQLILAILIIGITIIITCQRSILSPKYIIRQLYKNNYYEELYLSLQEDMSNHIIQSGLSNEVLENIYTMEMVEETTNQFVKDFYQNKSLEINTTTVKNNLETNITNYLKQNNIQITDQKSLDRFVEQMLSIYEEAFTFSNLIEPYQNTLHIFSLVLNTTLWLAIGIAIILIIFTRAYLKKNTFTVPLLTTGILILGGSYYLTSKIDFDHFLLFNESISYIIRNVVFDIMKQLRKISIVMIIISIILSFINSMIVYKIRRINKKVVN